MNSVGEKIRLGFVGAGYMGQLAHIANYAKIKECDLVAIADGRSETAHAVARRYGIRDVYSDHHELLDKADVDAVVGVLWFNLHYALVCDILGAGKPVLTEKPMCIDAENGRDLARRAHDAGVLYQIGFMKRHDPGSVYVRERVEAWRASGECGRLRYVRVTMPPGDWVAQHEGALDCGDDKPSYTGQSVESPPAWMSEEQANQYVSFVNFYIHQVDLIRYLIGEDYHVTYADPEGQTFTALSDTGVVIVLEMAAYGLANEWEETYRLCFDEGQMTLEIPPPLARQRSGNVAVYRKTGFTGGDDPEVMRPMLPPRWAFEEQARSFVRCLQDGTPTVAPPEDAIKDLEIAEEYTRALSSAPSL